MKKIYCDICNKEVNRNLIMSFYKPEIVEGYFDCNMQPIKRQIKQELDLCEECAGLIYSFVESEIKIKNK